MSNERVREIVLQSIMDAMEKGIIPWRKPWKDSGMRPCNIEGRKYNGINWLILSMMPHAIPVYLTFKQAQKLGGSVKKGEKGIPVSFWKMLKKTEDGVEKTIPLMRYFTVFNISQCEGIELPKRFVQSGPVKAFNPIAAAEAAWANMPKRPTLAFGGDRACYIPSKDEIHLPEKTAFESEEAYYATLFHEAGHSTGHASRLNRKEVVNTGMFGSMDYSLEELVAEMTSAMLCAETGIEQPILENAVAYLQSWYSKLSKEPGMLVTAASRAQKACDFIIGKAEEEQDPQAA